MQNLFRHTPDRLGGELVDALVQGGRFQLERIVSLAHATPRGEWYDQSRAEWIVLLSGSAGLWFEGEPEPREMTPGDWVNVPAHCRHRVEWTSADEATVWLALHYEELSQRQDLPETSSDECNGAGA